MGHWTDLMNLAADLIALATAVITLGITFVWRLAGDGTPLVAACGASCPRGERAYPGAHR
jgi:hypothetical protein